MNKPIKKFFNFNLDITKILAICAQATHDLVPPDYLESIVMIIANKFVNDRSSPESISAGLNTIREICSRQPRVMSKTLLSDLTRYIKSKNKYIVQSARGLVTLFREIDPLMLRRRDRGKDTDLSNKIKPFGSSNYDEVDGIELLEQFKQGKIDPEELEGLSSGSEIDGFSDEDSDSDDDQEITEDDILNSKQIFDGVSDDDDDSEMESDEEEEGDSDEEEGNDEGVDENGIVWKIKKVNDQDDSDEEEEDSDEEDDMMGGEDIQHSKNNSEEEEEDSDEEEGNDEDSEEDDDLMGGEDIINEDSESEEESESESEEEEKKSKVKKIPEKTKEEIQLEKEKFLSSEILTQEDFDLIKKLKKLKSLKKIAKKKMAPSQFVDLADIESSIRKKRKDLIADGEMPEKEKFKWERRKKTEGGSKTNLEKKKNKPFMMTKHSQGVRKKVKMGTNEKKWRKEKAMKKQIKFQIKHH